MLVLAFFCDSVIFVSGGGYGVCGWLMDTKNNAKCKYVQ